uniref:Metalloendopeptidase n=1 Tax=Astyanax mexicanus TaxID=7994 RepID=W5K2Q8_ASTMX
MTTKDIVCYRSATLADVMDLSFTCCDVTEKILDTPNHHCIIRTLIKTMCDNQQCWSYIGRNGGKQQLSIGIGCGYVGIVEHEFLHCLGFFHEQSRYDRDDYVTIHYENIPEERRNNFDKVSEDESTVQGTPYNYMSLMHYGQYDFSNTSKPTITAKDAKFQTFIGQRYDLSPLDAVELYNLYKCNESISFLDRCSFKDGTCQMANCSSANVSNWEIVSNVSGGPSSDHTNLPPRGNVSKCRPPFFMHFSTKTGQPGDSGRLESREMTPRRSCNVQCLEFFYYHSGNETDQLNIWIREYQSAYDTVGTLRLMEQITGSPTDHWQFRLVPLDASKTFQVEFEARKGNGYSRGGFSVDDINLSETECPHKHIFVYSPLFYSPEGYRFYLVLLLNSNTLEIRINLVSGIYDDRLQWPCPWRQVTFTLLDQNPDIRNRASKQRSFTTDPNLVIGEKCRINFTVFENIIFTFYCLLGLKIKNIGSEWSILVHLLKKSVFVPLHNNVLPCVGLSLNFVSQLLPQLRFFTFSALMSFLSSFFPVLILCILQLPSCWHWF